MSYADPAAPMSTRKLTAIIVVVALHAVVLFLMVTGGYKVIAKHVQKLTVLDITPPPPPPPLPPPPPPPPAPPQQQVSPPIVSPPTIVPVPSPPVQVQAVPVAPPAPPAPLALPPSPAPPPPAAPPAPPAVATPLKPRGDPGTWVTTDDYPPSALRDGVQGRTSFTLQVDGSGRVTSCTVTGSSGSSVLDETACRLLPRRARFSPAKDAAGNAIPAVFSSSVRWQVPKD